MSYQNVFFGDLKNPSFYSREGDDLEGGPEMEGDVHEMMKKNIKTFVKGRSRSSSSSSSSSRTRNVKKKR